MQQCRGIPGQGSGKGWIGEQGEGRGLMGLGKGLIGEQGKARGLMGLSGRGDPGKGKSFEM